LTLFRTELRGAAIRIGGEDTALFSYAAFADLSTPKGGLAVFGFGGDTHLVPRGAFAFNFAFL
tara:strand:+ start:3292 stop:3480 length:189 start_codon:yes stop_codon:yes gene_type:complete